MKTLRFIDRATGEVHENFSIVDFRRTEDERCIATFKIPEGMSVNVVDDCCEDEIRFDAGLVNDYNSYTVTVVSKRHPELSKDFEVYVPEPIDDDFIGCIAMKILEPKPFELSAVRLRRKGIQATDRSSKQNTYSLNQFISILKSLQVATATTCRTITYTNSYTAKLCK